VLHAVTALKAGVRKSLFVIDEQNGQGEGGVLEVKADAKVDFVTEFIFEKLETEVEQLRQENRRLSEMNALPLDQEVARDLLLSNMQMLREELLGEKEETKRLKKELAEEREAKEAVIQTALAHNAVLEQQSQEMDRLKSSHEPDCIVCMARPKTHAMLPCGHKSFCEECGPQLAAAGAACPVCRGQVSGIAVIHLDCLRRASTSK
jgi:hypothetical protein